MNKERSKINRVQRHCLVNMSRDASLNFEQSIIKYDGTALYVH